MCVILKAGKLNRKMTFLCKPFIANAAPVLASGLYDEYCYRDLPIEILINSCLPRVIFKGSNHTAAESQMCSKVTYGDLAFKSRRVGCFLWPYVPSFRMYFMHA